jgi:hypothetical protein
MTTRHDEEVLLLHPAFAIERAELRARLDDIAGGVLGAFRDPHEADSWLFPLAHDAHELRVAREARPGEHGGYTRAGIVADGRVQVVPGSTDLALGRAQHVVRALLALGPWDLEVRGRPSGRVTTLRDVYARDWPSPDDVDDPTMSPPVTGTLTTWRRELPDGREVVAVHDSGAMSYIRDRGDQRTVVRRRLDTATRKRWAELVAALPLDGDAPGPDGDFADAVFVAVDTPDAALGDVRIDAATAAPPYRELAGLFRLWTTALGADPEATPVGLTR